MSNKKNKRSNRAPGRNHFSFYFFYTIFLIFFRPLFKFKLTKKVKTIENERLIEIYEVQHEHKNDFPRSGRNPIKW